MTPATETVVATADGVTLAVEQAGEGTPVVLLHGLTATRRYVVMGSRLLERSGHRVIAYDARGHGRSTPAPTSDAYTYALLADDLATVMDALEIERATLAGASMGAHTILRYALEHPRRVAALTLITPAFEPGLQQSTKGMAPRLGGLTDLDQGEASRSGASEEPTGWDALAHGLRTAGIDGFVNAYDLSALPERWRATVLVVLRQRLAAHSHLDAVADALEVVPRSWPFDSLAELSRISVPTLVVASRDESDPGHPLAIGERYAAAIPGARLLVEQPGASPIAWQGGQLSRAIAELVKASGDA
jgi:pimeloyl-ACP methyl ester carboxylesterase